MAKDERVKREIDVQNAPACQVRTGMHEHKRKDTLTMSKTAKLNETVSTDSLTGLALLSAHRLHYF